MPSSRRSRRRPYGDEYRPLDVDRATGGRTIQERGGEDFTVQTIRKGTKDYTCPGCHQIIPAGTEHVVVWQNETIMGQGVNDRRHWHRACWRIGY